MNRRSPSPKKTKLPVDTSGTSTANTVHTSTPGLYTTYASSIPCSGKDPYGSLDQSMDATSRHHRKSSVAPKVDSGRSIPPIINFNRSQVRRGSDSFDGKSSQNSSTSIYSPVSMDKGAPKTRTRRKKTDCNGGTRTGLTKMNSMGAPTVPSKVEGPRRGGATRHRQPRTSNHQHRSDGGSSVSTTGIRTGSPKAPGKVLGPTKTSGPNAGKKADLPIAARDQRAEHLQRGRRTKASAPSAAPASSLARKTNVSPVHPARQPPRATTQPHAPNTRGDRPSDHPQLWEDAVDPSRADAHTGSTTAAVWESDLSGGDDDSDVGNSRAPLRSRRKSSIGNRSVSSQLSATSARAPLAKLPGRPDVRVTAPLGHRHRSSSTGSSGGEWSEVSGHDEHELLVKSYPPARRKLSVGDGEADAPDGQVHRERHSGDIGHAALHRTAPVAQRAGGAGSCDGPHGGRASVASPTAGGGALTTTTVSLMSSTTGSSTAHDATPGASHAPTPKPRLLFVSSAVKSYTVLHDAVLHEAVAVIQYDYASTTLAELRTRAKVALRGGRALSIAFIAHGQPGEVHLCGAPEATALSADSVAADGAVRAFVRALCALLAVPHGRLDLLATAAALGDEGAALHRALQTALAAHAPDPTVVLSSRVSAAPDGGRHRMLSSSATHSTTSSTSALPGRTPSLGQPDTYGVNSSAASDLVRDSHGNTDIDVVYAQYFNLEKIQEWVGPYTQTLAEYDFIRTVGQGAFGSAKLYQKRDDCTYVILKAVNLHRLSTKERQLALNEHVVLGMLDHPNVIRYFDCFEDNGTLQIEMEYADGGTLAQYLESRKKRQIKEQHVRVIFRQIVDAIHYIHGKSILHRDLKVQNIFLMLDGTVKVGDFGIAKQLAQASGGVRKANTVLGTPYYISPELCQGLEYDSKSDIWSLGCILYEMCTLTKAFTGDNLPALVKRIVDGRYTPIGDDYSHELRLLVTQMLSRHPAARPAAGTILAGAVCAGTGGERPLLHDGRGDGPAVLRSNIYYWARDSAIPRKLIFETNLRIEQVAVGDAHCCATASGGVTFTWGENNKGQLGHGDFVSRSEPHVIAALLSKPTARVACGGNVTAMISSNGLLQLCGEAQFGVLGCGDTSPDRPVPQLVHALLSMEVSDVALGPFHACAITVQPHGVYTWGRASKGRLGLGARTAQSDDVFSTPRAVAVPDGLTPTRAVCGVDGTMVLCDDGVLCACGNNEDNKLGLNSRPSLLRQLSHRVKRVDVAWELTRVSSFGKVEVESMEAGATFGGAVTTSGTCFMFGSNAAGGLGCGDTKELRRTASEIKSVLLGHRVTAVACGETFTVAAAVAHADTASTPSSASRPRTTAPTQRPLDGLRANKLFAWGRGMTDRCEKLDTDDATSIYLPSILALDDDATIVEIKGVACHADALAVLVDTVAATDDLGEPLITRKTSFIPASEGEAGSTVSSHESHVSSRDSLDATPVWLREEFARAVGENPGSAGALATTQTRASTTAATAAVDAPAAALPAHNASDVNTDEANDDSESSPVPLGGLVRRRSSTRSGGIGDRPVTAIGTERQPYNTFWARPSVRRVPSRVSRVSIDLDHTVLQRLCKITQPLGVQSLDVSTASLDSTARHPDFLTPPSPRAIRPMRPHSHHASGSAVFALNPLDEETLPTPLSSPRPSPLSTDTKDAKGLPCDPRRSASESSSVAPDGQPREHGSWADVSDCTTSSASDVSAHDSANKPGPLNRLGSHDSLVSLETKVREAMATFDEIQQPSSLRRAHRHHRDTHHDRALNVSDEMSPQQLRKHISLLQKSLQTAHRDIEAKNVLLAAATNGRPNATGPPVCPSFDLALYHTLHTGEHHAAQLRPYADMRRTSCSSHVFTRTHYGNAPVWHCLQARPHRWSMLSFRRRRQQPPATAKGESCQSRRAICAVTTHLLHVSHEHSRRVLVSHALG
eukprot:m.1419703 g.1419703  ORF g.1419703 m.1419703 type:complete len:1947 (-) comp25041_c0_seq7:305-6145(-)